jgi:hypothetical protein
MSIKNIILAAVVLQLSIPLIMPVQSFAEQIERLENVKNKRHYVSLEPDPRKLSPEEKEWYATFQEGNFYVQGWKEITAEILEKIPHKRLKGKLHQSLKSLGTKIGCEWSKSNDIRKIDNDMLEQWGGILKKAAKETPNRLPQVITDLGRKVAAVTN